MSAAGRGGPGPDPALAVHGGAGALRDDPDERARVRAGIRDALVAGYAVLCEGGAALDAVVAAVCVLEDHPAFNAGRGSVLNEAGGVEMDASVMEGTAQRAGGVAGLRGVANPVRAARAVLLDGRHVLLAGEGAEAFARAAGVPPVDPAALVVEGRRAQLERVRADPVAGRGTVGAVARDATGALAAATSTGGLVAKRVGRVSDSALPGAGTWADGHCAVSATGEGEVFVRTGFARAVALRFAEGGLPLEAACRASLAEVALRGGSGGCIALAATGDPVFHFDTPTLSRGVVAGDGVPRLAIGPEPLAPSEPPRTPSPGA